MLDFCLANRVNCKQTRHYEKATFAVSRSNRFQSTLWDLQRRLGQNALVPLSALAEQAYLPTGYHALNDLLGGGLPTGKTTALVGAPSSGVTSLTYSLMAQAQTKDRAVVYLDLDTTLDAGYSARCGVALDRLLIVRLDDAEKSLEIMRTLVTAANVSLVVLDATGTDRLSTLLPQLPSALSRLKVGLARSSSVLLLVFQTLPGESVQANIDALLRLKRKAWLTCCDDISGYQVEVTVLKDSKNGSARAVDVEILLQDEPL